jgi:hypothetical protein
MVLSKERPQSIRYRSAKTHPTRYQSLLKEDHADTLDLFRSETLQSDNAVEDAL